MRITRADYELWDGRRWWIWGHIDGLPAFTYGHAPDGLATLDQLHQQGRRRARGQEPYAVLAWRSARFGRQAANLYRLDQTVPAQPFTTRQRAALTLAYLAKFQCVRGHEAERYVDPATRRCGPCRDAHMPA